MGKTLPSANPTVDSLAGEVLIPNSEEERIAVLAQLDRVLESPLFANSKRYPRFLKYIVEETLAGRCDGLKERALGMTVFGRDPLYDTNLDPVVRTSAAQVRQRMTRYYAEASHQFELRIELTPGSYIPEFRLPLPDQIALEVVDDLDIPVAARTGSSARRWLILSGLLITLLFLGFLLRPLLTNWTEASVTNKFWKPIWEEKDPIILCVPGRFPSDADMADGVPRSKPLSILESLHLNSIAWPDATSLYTLVGFVKTHGESYVVRRAGDSSLADLRGGPTIFVGGFNNSWLIRLQSRYRFTYERDIAAGTGMIRDARHPDRTAWRVHWNSPYASFEEDYGIVSRVFDPVTEHVVTFVSGIAAYGTIAAGEFVTSPKYLALIAAAAPKGWERKNIQVVFSTRVFNGNAGPPRIIAVEVW